MKKLNLDLSQNGIKALLGKTAKNLSWLFLAAFLFLVLMEIFQVKTSLRIVLKSRQEIQVQPPLKTGTRIDFSNYEQVVKRIKQAKDFKPSGGITKNPFQLIE